MNRTESGPSKRHPKRSRHKPPRPDGIGHRSTKPIGKVRLLAGRPSLALFLTTLALVLADPGLRLLNVSPGCDSRRGYEPHAPSSVYPHVVLEACASPSWQIPGKHLLSVSSGCNSRRGDDSAPRPDGRERLYPRPGRFQADASEVSCPGATPGGGTKSTIETVNLAPRALEPREWAFHINARKGERS